MLDSSYLDAEIRYRLKLGQHQQTLAQFSNAIRAIGYRFDRRFDCRSLPRYMTGERAGHSYPALSLKPVQTDNGMAWSHFEARRDANYKALMQLRESVFAVVGGAIAEF